MKLENELNSIDCCGCEACVQVCPVKCISMAEDSEGFLVPYVDESKCIECRSCINVCPKNKDIAQNDVKRLFAVTNPSVEIVKRSSSAGVFSVLAEKVISEKGIVYGAGYDSDGSVKHMAVTKMDELDNIRRSKYVQSRIDNTFIEIKEALIKDKKVLFAGTPCQVAGLRSFLKKDYDNLLCIDIVCHGVPSPGLFRKHKEYLEKKNKKKIEKIEFRLKKKLNKPYYNCSIHYNDNIYKNQMCFSDIYFKLFLKQKTLRNSCYICKYAGMEREGDITLGDYGWAVNYHKDIKDYYGAGINISLVMINTKKGNEYTEYLSKHLNLIETKAEWAKSRNKTLYEPSDRPEERDTIYKEINEKGYEEFAERYRKTDEFLEYRRLGFRYFKAAVKKKIKIILQLKGEKR